MKYGRGFWVVKDGVRQPVRSYPKTVGFDYNDGTGDVGEFLLEDFTVDYQPPGHSICLRMTVRGNPDPVLHGNSFDFDFASVPKLFRTVTYDKADHRIRVGSLFHDMGYCVHRTLSFTDRKFWDTALVEMAEAYGMSWMKRQATYSAVRIGGHFAWPKTQKELDTYRGLFEVKQIPVT